MGGPIVVRVGVEGGAGRAVVDSCRRLGAPVMVSANSLWDDRRKAFARTQAYAGLDVALDSGGFVAMRRYGGYRWSVPQYVGLAKSMAPTWWAQMDWCCEPELAADRPAVLERVGRTASHLAECMSVADGEGAPPPIPVLQGWRPEDYCNGPIYGWSEWPPLVGVGSVCRRHVGGPDGLMAIVEALDRAVPPSTRLHLFGVKSTALSRLAGEYPGRIASVDSMAWHRGGSWAAHHAGVRFDCAARAAAMESWYAAQTARLDGPRQSVFRMEAR